MANSPLHACFAEVAARAENMLLDNGQPIVTTRVSHKIQDIADDTTGLVWHQRLFEMLCGPSFENVSQARRIAALLRLCIRSSCLASLTLSWITRS